MHVSDYDVKTVTQRLGNLLGYPPLWESTPSLELLYGLLQYTGGLAIALTHWQLRGFENLRLA